MGERSVVVTAAGGCLQYRFGPWPGNFHAAPQNKINWEEPAHHLQMAEGNARSRGWTSALGSRFQVS